MLPPLPALVLRKLQDLLAKDDPYHRHHAVEVELQYPDRSRSAPFTYHYMTRRQLDAVVVCAHFKERGQRHVFVRSALRPPVTLREEAPTHDGAFWELPAGLLDPGEDPAAGGARELLEELGFPMAPSSLTPLGPWTFPVPAVLAERHVYFHVEVDPTTRGTPTEDGSALERFGEVVALPLAQLLHEARAGHLRDGKTELGLRRLAELP